MKVPIYEPKVKEDAVMAETPSVSRGVSGMTGEAEAQALTGLGKAGENLANTLTRHIQRQNYWKAQEQGMELGNRFNDAVMNLLNDTNQTAKEQPDGSTINIPNGLLLREGHLAEGAALEYRTKVDQIKEAFLSQIKDPIVMKTFVSRANEIDRTGYNAAIRHQATHWRSAAIKSISSFANEEIKRYPLADEEGRLKIYAGVHERINEAGKSGLLDEAQMLKYKQNFEEQLFYSTVDIDPQGTINELTRKDGIYQNLDEDKRRKLAIQASQAVERRRIEVEKLKNIAIDKNERDLLKSRLDGQLTPQQVNELKTNGEIRPEFADLLIEGFFRTHKIADYNKRSDVFSSIFIEIADMYENTDAKGARAPRSQEEIRDHITKNNNFGFLTDEEAKILNTFNEKMIADTSAPAITNARAMEKWIKDNKILQSVHRSWLYREYMNRVNAGEDPEKAADIVKRTFVLSQVPDAVNGPKSGRKFMDISGAMRLITPTGAIEYITEVMSGKAKNKPEE